MDLSFRSSMRLERLGALEEMMLPKEPFRRLILVCCWTYEYFEFFASLTKSGERFGGRSRKNMKRE